MKVSSSSSPGLMRLRQGYGAQDELMFETLVSVGLWGIF